MKWMLILLVLAGLAAGCTTKSKARNQARNAYMAGQNAVMQRQMAQQQASGAITVIGPVQNSLVPWVAGISLAQAMATANYLSPHEPSQIILTRNGEDGMIDPKNLDAAAKIMLEPGDVITIRE